MAELPSSTTDKVSAFSRVGSRRQCPDATEQAKIAAPTPYSARIASTPARRLVTWRNRDRAQTCRCIVSITIPGTDPAPPRREYGFEPVHILPLPRVGDRLCFGMTTAISN